LDAFDELVVFPIRESFRVLTLAYLQIMPYLSFSDAEVLTESLVVRKCLLEDLFVDEFVLCLQCLEYCLKQILLVHLAELLLLQDVTVAPSFNIPRLIIDHPFESELLTGLTTLGCLVPP